MKRRVVVTGIGPITSASLTVFSYAANDSGQTFTLWDVTTPYVILGSPNPGTYNDLESGIQYGSGIHTAGITNTFVLNAAAISSINSTSGLWAIGGSNDGVGNAFGFNQGLAQLVVETIPEPSGSILAAGIGLLVARRRRR